MTNITDRLRSSFPSIPAMRDAADEIDAQAAEIASRKSMLDLVINSVCGALERAGVEAVDDPGEAIDVLVADKDREIARLREALTACIAVIQDDRDEMEQCAADPKGRVSNIDAVTRGFLAEYDAVLMSARAALSGESK